MISYKKGCRVLCKRVSVRYAWIKEHKDIFPVTVMCRFVKVSRSSYYEWLDSPEGSKTRQDKELTKIITSIFKEGRSIYGTRRIKKKLALQGKTISRRRLSRLMNEAGLVCKTKRKFKATTDSKHTDGRRIKVPGNVA